MLPAGGFLPLLKPRGITTRKFLSKVANVVRSSTTMKGPRIKLGHSGALDPAAEGIIIGVVGRANSIAPALACLPMQKEYLVTVRLGLQTDTDDVLGRTIAQGDARSVTSADVEAARASCGDDVSAVPGTVKPAGLQAKSVIHVSSASRTGYASTAPLPEQWHSDVSAESLRGVGMDGAKTLCPKVLQSFEPGSMCMDAVIRVRCRKDAEVRTIARDLGLALGVGGGCVVRLVRSCSDGFGMEDAVRLEDLNEDTLLRYMVPPSIPFLRACALGSDAFQCVLDDASAPSLEALNCLQIPVQTDEEALSELRAPISEGSPLIGTYYERHMANQAAGTRLSRFEGYEDALNWCFASAPSDSPNKSSNLSIRIPVAMPPLSVSTPTLGIPAADVSTEPCEYADAVDRDLDAI